MHFWAPAKLIAFGDCGGVRAHTGHTMAGGRRNVWQGFYQYSSSFTVGARALFQITDGHLSGDALVN